MYLTIFAAAIPALRPLWAKSAYQNQKNRGKVCRPDKKKLPYATHVIADQQLEADPLFSGLETRITVQDDRNQGSFESKVGSLSDRTGIMRTTDVSLENFRKVEGKWITENSNNSDRERSVEDMV